VAGEVIAVPHSANPIDVTRTCTARSLIGLPPSSQYRSDRTTLAGRSGDRDPGEVLGGLNRLQPCCPVHQVPG